MENTLIADIIFSTEALGVVGTLVAALSGVISYLFHHISKSNSREIRALTSERESYKGIARDALKHLESLINRDLAAKGAPPLILIAPVIPEHQSPSTPDQQEVAQLATLRARLVAAQLSLGVEATP
jgi:hypothetical protein